MDILKNLKKHFGLDAFRQPQEAIVQSVLDGKDTLVIMPTGGGKSLCFQLPALLLPGTTLVVSPLIALMKDQVDGLQARGIPAAMINSSQTWPQQQAILSQLQDGEIKLLYVSPERFRARSFMDALRHLKIDRLAIDEAHCISQWGHDFRPDYLRIGEALKQLGRPPCVALTATATPEVREDIAQRLNLQQPNTFVSGFARDNLSFSVRVIKRVAEKFSRIAKLIDSQGTGIIYCATRKSVEEVSDWLNEENIEHIQYHGGLRDTERSEAQTRFVSGEVGVAVATNAFGMGIDRSDIRFVCHYEMPGSIEAYYQEAGRAGRDGKPAFCELLFLYADKRVQEFFIEGSNPDPALIRSTYAHLLSQRNENNEVLLPMDELAKLIGRRTNGMAVSAALGQLRRQGIVERFDVPGSRIRGSRILKPDLMAADLEVDEAALAEKKRRDDAKLKKVIQFGYASSCRQQWILRYFGEMNTHACGRCDACAQMSASPPRALDEQELTTLKKALSGVARMSQRIRGHQWQARYGRDRIIKCLLGSKAQGIVAPGLDKLTTHGLLKQYGSGFLGELFDAMTRAGMVEVTDGDYPLLQLTEYGSQVMFGEAEAEVQWPGASLNSIGEAAEKPANPGLFDQLVQLRNQIRRQRGNPPAYTIFPNTVLKQLAAIQPTTAEEAMTIKGIGPAKAESLLPAFLELIQGYQE